VWVQLEPAPGRPARAAIKLHILRGGLDPRGAISSFIHIDSQFGRLQIPMKKPHNYRAIELKQLRVAGQSESQRLDRLFRRYRGKHLPQTASDNPAYRR
jgi:hypothetical protein